MRNLISGLYQLFYCENKKEKTRRSYRRRSRYDPPFDVGGFLFGFRAQGSPPTHKGNRFSLALSHFVTVARTLRYSTTENPITTMQLQTFVCVLAGLLVLSCSLQTAVAQSNNGKMKSMAEVLQILQNLDKYYSQAARPRFGKRTYPSLEDHFINGEEMPIGEAQPWERFIR